MKTGGCIYLDRRTSITRRSGENISTLKVDAALSTDPGVADAAVTPVPDPIREEEVFAFVVAKPGHVDAEALMHRLALRLSYHKLPGFLLFCEALPVSSTQKLQRGQIRGDVEEAVRAVRSGPACAQVAVAQGDGGMTKSPFLSRGTPQGYDGVVIAAPVTVPYERYSTHPAQWWAGQALRALAEAADCDHRDIDGLSVASFSLAPDSAIGLTLHFGLSPRHLDFGPLGGVAAVVSLRRAARAVQAGDTNAPEGFRDALENFSRFSQDAVYPYGTGGPNVRFSLIVQACMRKPAWRVEILRGWRYRNATMRSKPLGR
jgi:hypothetical protein